MSVVWCTSTVIGNSLASSLIYRYTGYSTINIDNNHFKVLTCSLFAWNYTFRMLHLSQVWQDTEKLIKLLMRVSRKYPYSPKEGIIIFCEWGASVRPGNWKKCMKLNLPVIGVSKGVEKNPPCGGGTVQYMPILWNYMYTIWDSC